MEHRAQLEGPVEVEFVSKRLIMLRIVSLGTLSAYWIALFVGTHIPDGVNGVANVSDKLLHFGAYAGLAFLLAFALSTLRVKYGALLLPVVVAAIYGCIDELSQMAVPGRQAELADWAADVCGAGTGVFALGVASLIVARCFARPAAAAPEVIRKTAA